jgi:hypothetical protein
MSRAADFAKLLTHSEGAPETQRKLLNRGGGTAVRLGQPKNTGSNPGETAETQGVRETARAMCETGASTTGQTLCVPGGKMAPRELHFETRRVDQRH